MFDIGFLELMMIGVVSLVVIGPERLPEVAAKVGKTVAKAQRFVRGVKSDINRELESGDLKQLLGDQKKQIEELRQMVHTASKDVESSASSALKDAEKSFSEISEPHRTDLAGNKISGSDTSASTPLPEKTGTTPVAGDAAMVQKQDSQPADTDPSSASNNNAS